MILDAYSTVDLLDEVRRRLLKPLTLSPTETDEEYEAAKAQRTANSLDWRVAFNPDSLSESEWEEWRNSPVASADGDAARVVYLDSAAETDAFWDQWESQRFESGFEGDGGFDWASLGEPDEEAEPTGYWTEPPQPQIGVEIAGTDAFQLYGDERTRVCYRDADEDPTPIGEIEATPSQSARLWEGDPPRRGSYREADAGVVVVGYWATQTLGSREASYEAAEPIRAGDKVLVSDGLLAVAVPSGEKTTEAILRRDGWERASYDPDADLSKWERRSRDRAASFYAE